LPYCGWEGNPILVLTTALTDQTMTFTSITSASIMDLLINQSDNDLADSISCVDFYSGIDENVGNKITLYPNPVNEKVTVELTGKANGTLTILDLNGKVILSAEVLQSTMIIDLSALNNGIYVYSFMNKEDQTVTNGKLIKN
jgi:hypothetical protein